MLTNRRPRLPLFLAGVIMVSMAIASEVEPSREFSSVQDDVRRIVVAVYGSDVDATMSFTYPAIIAILGGESEARKRLAKAFAMVQSIELKLESFEFPSDPIFVAGEVNDYVIVPTRSIVSARGLRIRSVNFQFGVRSKRNGRGTYVEGSRVTRELLDAQFPDFSREDMNRRVDAPGGSLGARLLDMTRDSRRCESGGACPEGRR